MNIVRAFSNGPLGRALCALQSLLLLLSTSCVAPGAAVAFSGLRELHAPTLLDVPGAIVNLAGGNLMVERVDLALDTHMGTRRVGAFYNSAMRAWIWSFQMKYDGKAFVDATGALHDVRLLGSGEAIPGTHWVVVDDRRIKTKGGLVYTFDPSTYGLATLSWVGHPTPNLVYASQKVSGADRIVAAYQCRDAFGCQTAYLIEYDENGCVNALRDRAGREAYFESDRSCQIETARDPMDVARDWPGSRYEYSGGMLSALTNSEGERVEYDHLDGRIRRVRAIGGAGEPELVTGFRFGREPGGDRLHTVVEHPNGAESVYRYDELGRLAEHMDPVGDLTTWQWSGSRPALRVDPAGAATHWEVAGDDVVRMTLPSGNVIDFEYAPQAENRMEPRARPIARVTDSLGLVHEREYGTTGSLVATRNGAGETTAYGYNREGSIISMNAPGGELTQLFYHGFHGHPETALRAGFIEHRVYDATGNLLRGAALDTSLAPGRPGIVRRIFDEDRNLAGFVLEGGSDADPYARQPHLLLIEFRSDGRVRRVHRPYGGLEERDYDGYGRLVRRRERVDGVFSETQLSYDAAGRVVAALQANGMRREIDRDASGRETALRLLRDGILEQSLSRTFVQGRLVSMSDSAHSADEQIVYDVAGRPERIIYPDGEILEVGYDVRSRETLHRYLAADGVTSLRSLSFAYDGADRRTGIQDGVDSVWERDVSAGRDAQLRFGNGLVQDFAYHPEFGTRTASTIVRADGHVVSEGTLSWSECHDDRLCVTSQTHVYGEEPYHPVSTTEEGYVMSLLASDDRSIERAGLRLEGYATTASDAHLWWSSDRQAFDALGNRIGVGDGVGLQQRFHYNAERNRLIGADLDAVHSYEYDEAGYMTRRDGAVLGWDAGGRLAAVGADISLAWDVLGRPVSSSIEGIASRMRYGGRVRGDAAGNPVSLEIGDIRIDLVSGARRYRHRDFRGNVKLVSDDAGEFTLHRGYGPFGVESVLGSGDDDRGFAGGAEVGDLIRLGERFYDPQTGRFISPDPILHRLNQHAYTLGNPVLLWDPDGREADGVSTSSHAGYAQAGVLVAGLGIALISIGYGGKSPVVTTVGAVLFIGGVLVVIRFTPRVSAGAAIGGTSRVPTGKSSAGDVSELSTDASIGCSPVAFARPSAVSLTWLIMLVGQLLLAAALVDRYGARSRRR